MKVDKNVETGMLIHCCWGYKMKQCDHIGQAEWGSGL